MKFSVCVDMVFNHLPFASRIAAAADCGADAVEFWGWHDKNLDEVRKASAEHGIAVAGILTDSADANTREALSLVNDAGHSAFVRAVRESCAVARGLGAGALIVTTGNEMAGVPRAVQHGNIIRALGLAAPVAEGEGITLCLEPLNLLVDHKGYFLSRSEEAFAIVDAVGSPAVKVLFDIYHQQVTEGNVTANLTANAGKIGHIHVADAPGRHEPGSGELNYRNIFAAIERAGYAGFVGFEFMPTADHAKAVRDTLALRP